MLNIPTLKGFSIMEMMIAGFILSIGLIAVLQLFSGSMQTSFESRDRIIASGLAQEGTELVRNIRDTNKANGRDVFAGLSDGTCALDATEDLNCDGSEMRLSRSDGMYVLGGGGDPTQFSRRITIENEVDRIEIESMVVWDRTDFPDIEDCRAAENCAAIASVLTER